MIHRERSGNPVMHPFSGSDRASSMRRQACLAGENNVTVFVCSCVQKIRSQAIHCLNELLTCSPKLGRLPFKSHCVGGAEPTADPQYRVLKLLSAFQVAFQHADAEGTQGRNDMLAEHTQGFRRVARNQYRLLVSQQVADQVRNRMALAGAWWTLDQDGPVLVEAFRDLHLLGVGFLCEEDRSRRARGCGTTFGFDWTDLVGR